MRFHVLALPHTVSSEEYACCAFTQKIVKFCRMMHNDHTIIHYGHERSEVDATECVTVMTDQDLLDCYKTSDWKSYIYSTNVSDSIYPKFNERASKEIAKRKQRGDFLLVFWNLGHMQIIKDHPDLLAVEPGIGCFNPVVTPFAIFESYAVMHTIYGKYDMKPRWFDAVVPNYFDPKDFDAPEKDLFPDLEPGFVLFIGRMIEQKGIDIVIQATKETRDRLVLAGNGHHNFVFHERSKYVGTISIEQRKCLLRKAKCLMLPTYYLEPFGGVVVEAQMAGCPVITSDWGAFPEIVDHGRHGYRCRTMEQFTWALQNIHKLDRSGIEAYARGRWSLGVVKKMYEEYFRMLSSLYQEGFYAKRQRENLDWLMR